MPVEKLVQMKRSTILFLVVLASTVVLLNNVFYIFNDYNKKLVRVEVENQLKKIYSNINEFKEDRDPVTKLIYIDDIKPVEPDKQVDSNKNDCSSKDENTDNPRDYLKRYPFILNCKNEYQNKIDDSEFAKPAVNETHNLRITRAIIFYFPIEISQEFLHEVKWLYRGYIEMLKYEPSKWRTDLIFFVENNLTQFNQTNFVFNQLNCSFKHIRNRADDEPMCTLIDYVPIAKREFGKLPDEYLSLLSPNDRYQYLLNKIPIFSNSLASFAPFYSFLKQSLKSYNYQDSILMAFDGYEYFKTAGFDFLIRSDMDVFLTPLFSVWLPNNCNDFYVGGSSYSNDFNRNRLARIAKNIGLEYAYKDNLGSTWYSSPDQFRIVSFLTLFSMAYLSTEEFTEPERKVLLLYGQHLALNHLIALDSAFNLVKKDYPLLDYPSANELSINKVLNIHVFHGEDLFSKFMFKMGRYDDFKLPSINDSTKIKYYCLKLALESKRTNSTDLVKIAILKN